MTSSTVTSQPGREVHSHHRLSCGSLCLHKQICIMPTSLLTLLIVKRTKNLIKSHRGSAGKESTCNAGDLGSIPGWGRFWRRKRILAWRIPWTSMGLQRVIHNWATFTHSREIKGCITKMPTSGKGCITKMHTSGRKSCHHDSPFQGPSAIYDVIDSLYVRSLLMPTEQSLSRLCQNHPMALVCSSHLLTQVFTSFWASLVAGKFFPHFWLQIL